MKRTFRGLGFLLVLMLVTSAHPQERGAADFARECVQEARQFVDDMDIANHPRLKEYCDCYGKGWADDLKRNSRPSPDAFFASQAALRIRCRQQVGMPARGKK